MTASEIPKSKYVRDGRGHADGLALIKGDPSHFGRHLADDCLSSSEVDDILRSDPDPLDLARVVELMKSLTNYMMAKESGGRFPAFRDRIAEHAELQSIDSQLRGPECHCAVLGYAACPWHQDAIADALWPGER